MDQSWNLYKQISNPWLEKLVKTLRKIPLTVQLETLLESSYFWDLPPTLLYPNVNMKSSTYYKFWKKIGALTMENFFILYRETNLAKTLNSYIRRGKMGAVEWTSFLMPTRGLAQVLPITTHLQAENKQLNQITLKEWRHVTAVRSQSFSKIGEEISENYPDIWKAIHESILPSKFSSFLWKLHSGYFPTLDKLNKWGLIPSNACHFCMVPEIDLLHRFWECSAAQSVWTWAQAIWNPFPPVNSSAVYGNTVWTSDNIFNLIFYTACMWCIHTRFYRHSFNSPYPTEPYDEIRELMETLGSLYLRRLRKNKNSQRDLWRLQDLLGRLKHGSSQ